MSTILKALLSALNWQQIITFVFMTAAPMVISAVVPLPFQMVATTLATAICSLLLVIVRKPSAQGGTAAAPTASK